MLSDLIWRYCSGICSELRIFIVEDIYKLDMQTLTLWSTVRVRVRVTLRLAVYRQAHHFGVKLLETHGQQYFVFNWNPAIIVLLQHSLWREDGSVVYNCCWSSLAQSFSGPSPSGFMIIFYSLRFETPPTWRERSQYLYPPGTGWSSYTPRHWVSLKHKSI
jgi:hypothetical protein